jgi:hypothetical protein
MMNRYLNPLVETQLITPEEEELAANCLPDSILNSKEVHVVSNQQTKVEKIPSLWFYILSLHLAGKPAKQISELVDRHPLTIYKILKDPRVVQVRQQILDGVGNEFEALYSDVVQTIRDGINDPDIEVRLTAADKWLKAHGKYGSSNQVVNHLTAEDVVINILNQNGGNGARAIS